MVRIIAGILGAPKGKVSNYVYRTINGQTFASERPKHYNASKSIEAKSNRTRFGIAIQYAKYVNSIPELSKIWKHAKVKGATSFNKIVKHNIKSINNNFLTVHNIITPNSNRTDRQVYIKNLSLNNESISLSIQVLDNKFFQQLASPVILYAIIAFQDPKPRNRIPISLTHVSVDITSSIDKETNKLELNLTAAQKHLMQKYKQCNVYFALVIDSPVLKNIKYTQTYAETFHLK